MTSAETLLFPRERHAARQSPPALYPPRTRLYAEEKPRDYEADIKAAALKAAMLQGWLKNRPAYARACVRLVPRAEILQQK